MMNKVKDIFVTNAVYVTGNETSIAEKVRSISSSLSKSYAHHEILVVGDASMSASAENELCEVMRHVDFVRFMKAFGRKSRDTLEAIALENAIGDIVVVGSLDEIADYDAMHQLVSKCCDGNDVVMAQSTYGHLGLLGKALHAFLSPIDGFKRIPSKFTGMCCASRRAINAASKLPRFERFPFLRLASAMQHVEALPVAHPFLQKSDLTSLKEALDIASYNTSFYASALCVLALSESCIAMLLAPFANSIGILLASIFADLAAALLFMNCSLNRLIADKLNQEQYSIEYDKHSSVMLDLTELNIRSDSTSDIVNKVQTGRDR